MNRIKSVWSTLSNKNLNVGEKTLCHYLSWYILLKKSVNVQIFMEIRTCYGPQKSFSFQMGSSFLGDGHLIFCKANRLYPTYDLLAFPLYFFSYRLLTDIKFKALKRLKHSGDFLSWGPFYSGVLSFSCWLHISPSFIHQLFYCNLILSKIYPYFLGQKTILSVL